MSKERHYTDEQLEHNRAWQREYSRKKRAAEKLANPKPPKPTEKQQFSLGKQEKPRTNQPLVRTRAELKEIRSATVKQHEDYWQRVEAEKEAARDWWDSSQSFFAKFRKEE